MQSALWLILLLIIVAAIWSRLQKRYARDEKEPDTGWHASKLGEGVRHLNAQKARYQTLTVQALAALPDEAMLEAVLSNLWAKMDTSLRNAWQALQPLSTQRKQFYALYTVVGDTRQDGFYALRKRTAPEVLSHARELFAMLAAPQTLALYDRVLEAPLDTRAARDALAAYETPFLEAFKAEDVYAQLVAFVRAHADAFCDAEDA